MGYRFVIRRGRRPLHRRRVAFVAPNNEIVFWTEGYNSRAAALEAIGLLKAHAADAPIDDRT